jgi:hypothetical protein
MAITINGTNGLTTDNGALKLDTDTLVVDETNNRVGINTTSPANSLEVVGAIVAQGAATAYTNTGLYLQNKGSSVFDVGAWRSGASVAELSFSTDSGSDAAPVERMRIDSSGNVGIGTTSPAMKLDVTGGGIKIGYQAAPTWTTDSFLWSESGVGLNIDGFNLKFNTGASRNERMRIDSSGNVGIGTNSPASILEVSATEPYITISSTASQTGNALGGIRFDTADPSYGAGGYPAYITAQDISANGSAFGLVFGTQNAERMRINHLGNVGIGTSSPATKLHVLSGTNAGISVNDGTVNTILYNTSSANGSLGTTTNHPMAFYANNAERMRITSAGNVGIGTTSPDSKLHTSGANIIEKLTSSTAFAAKLFVSSTTTGYGRYIAAEADNMTFGRYGNAEHMRIDSSGTFFVGTTVSNASDGGFVVSAIGTICVGNSAGSSGAEFATFRRSGTQIGSITQSGTTAVAYNTSSDYRLKEDWQPMSGSVDRVKALNPVNFAWKLDGSRVDGFLAHEAQAIVPEAVTGTKDAVDAEGKPDYQGIDQSKLVPLLTAALQEALAAIESLTARVSALEGN